MDSIKSIADEFGYNEGLLKRLFADIVTTAKQDERIINMAKFNDKKHFQEGVKQEMIRIMHDVLIRHDELLNLIKTIDAVYQYFSTKLYMFSILPAEVRVKLLQ